MGIHPETHTRVDSVGRKKEKMPQSLGGRKTELPKIRLFKFRRKQVIFAGIEISLEKSKGVRQKRQGGNRRYRSKS